MRRPRWIVALVFALIVAAVFAWLGRWQMDHAITAEQATDVSSEDPRPIVTVTGPGETVTDQAAGMVVTLEGRLIADDLRVIEERTQEDRIGAWVTGHVAVEDGAEGNLAVALGWAPTVAEAEAALAEIAQDPAWTGAALSLEGRYQPGDGAVVPGADEDPFRLSTMVPAQLVNVWEPFDGPAYSGYLVLHPAGDVGADALAAAGLEAIVSVAPLPVETINWLNLFYAVEWVVFAGFAVFLWYRLARDDWEKQHELLRLAREAEAEAAAEDAAETSAVEPATRGEP